VFLIDSDGRTEIGTLDGAPRGMNFVAGKTFRRPRGQAKLELVPAPELTRSNWDQSAFVNQKFTIDEITTEYDGKD
jgi:hypothetical protein